MLLGIQLGTVGLGGLCSTTELCAQPTKVRMPGALKIISVSQGNGLELMLYNTEHLSLQRD